MKSLSKIQMAYLAGLIDGEGSIFVQRVKTQNSKMSRSGFHYRAGLAICMTDHDTVKWCASITGCGKVSSAKQGKKNHRPAYRWSVWSRQSANLLSILLPYLRLKKPHAQNLIEFQKSMSWYGCLGCPSHEILRREKHRKISKKLNKRGR